MSFSSPRTSVIAALAGLGLLLAGCGSDVGSASKEAVNSDCGTVNLALSQWVGYTANVAVVKEVLESELGCEVVQKDLAEEVSWEGFKTDEVDVILENWRPDMMEKYTSEGLAVNMGPNGIQGIIGWYVAPWMAEEYPDITNWENLNKYADLFKTSESGDKGQFLGGDSSYVTNDEALIKNLDLNYQVVFTGSEAGLIQAFRDSEKNKTPAIGYFYEPQWLFTELPLVKVNLPEWTEGCDADTEAVACDYPVYVLDKAARKAWVDSGSSAVKVIENFEWTNEDQAVVSKYIEEDGDDPAAAAKKWIADNRDKVEAWLA